MRAVANAWFLLLPVYFYHSCCLTARFLVLLVQVVPVPLRANLLLSAAIEDVMKMALLGFLSPSNEDYVLHMVPAVLAGGW